MTLSEVMRLMGPRAWDTSEDAIYAWFNEQIGAVLAKHVVEPTPLLTLLVADVSAHAVMVNRIERWVSLNVPQFEEGDVRKRASLIETGMDMTVKAHAALRKSIIDVRAFLEEAGTPIPTGPAGELLNLLATRPKGLPAPPIVPPGPGSPLTSGRPDIQASVSGAADGETDHGTE